MVRRRRRETSPHQKMAITVIGNIPIFGLTGLWNFAHIADRK
jgi:hypothetical protein